MCNECGPAWRKYNVRSLKGTEKEKEIEKQRAIERAERAERKAQETPDRESPPVTRSAKLKAEINSKGGPMPTPMPAPETRAERAERRGENNALTQSTTGKREREGSPLPGPPPKRQRMGNGVVPAARLMCSLCKRVGPQGQVVKCATCNFTIHAGKTVVFNWWRAELCVPGCVGVPPEEATADWTCEICTNEESETSNIVSNIVLMPIHLTHAGVLGHCLCCMPQAASGPQTRCQRLRLFPSSQANREPGMGPYSLRNLYQSSRIQRRKANAFGGGHQCYSKTRMDTRKALEHPPT